MIWMYYTTDGDSGYYNIKLFRTKEMAEQHKFKEDDAYGAITEIEIQEPGLPYQDVKCPECGGKMVSRKGSYGMFWGCASYPNCRGTRDSEGRSKAERDEQKNKVPEPKSWNVR